MIRASTPATPAARAHRIVDARGRAKVFRPLPPAERVAAVGRGVEAYARGAFYLAHEELEPAWMGADDPGERELLAALIKLAAAGVHAARGNPAGVATNLRGARARLEEAAVRGFDGGFDLEALRAAVDERLGLAAALGAGPTAPRGTLPDPPHDVAGPPGRARRPPLDLDPPPLTRRTTA